MMKQQPASSPSSSSPSCSASPFLSSCLASTVIVRVSTCDSSGMKQSSAVDPINPGRIVFASSGVILGSEQIGHKLDEYVRTRTMQFIDLSSTSSPNNSQPLLGAYIVCTAATTIAQALKKPRGFSTSASSSSFGENTFEHASTQLFPELTQGTVVDVLGEIPIVDLKTHSQTNDQTEVDDSAMTCLNWHQAHVVAVGTINSVSKSISSLLARSPGNWVSGWPTPGSSTSDAHPVHSARVALLFAPTMVIGSRKQLSSNNRFPTEPFKRHLQMNASALSESYRNASLTDTRMVHPHYYNQANSSTSTSSHNNNSNNNNINKEEEWLFEQSLIVVGTPFCAIAPMIFHRSVSRATVSNAFGKVQRDVTNGNQGILNLRERHGSGSREREDEGEVGGGFQREPNYAVLLIDGRCLPGMEGSAVYSSKDGTFMGMMTLPLCSAEWPVITTNSGNAKSAPNRYEDEQRTLLRKLGEWETKHPNGKYQRSNSTESGANRSTTGNNVVPSSSLLVAPSFSAHVNVMISSAAIIIWLEEMTRRAQDFVEAQSSNLLLPQLLPISAKVRQSDVIVPQPVAMQAPLTGVLMEQETCEERGQRRLNRVSREMQVNLQDHPHEQQFHPTPHKILTSDNTGAMLSSDNTTHDRKKPMSVVPLSEKAKQIPVTDLAKSIVSVRMNSSWAAGVLISSNGYVITSAHLIRPWVETPISTTSPTQNQIDPNVSANIESMKKLSSQKWQTTDELSRWVSDRANLNVLSPNLQYPNGLIVRVEPGSWAFSRSPKSIKRGDRAPHMPTKHAAATMIGGSGYNRNYQQQQPLLETSEPLDFVADLVYLSPGVVDVALLKIHIPRNYSLCAAKLPSTQSVGEMWRGLQVPGRKVCVIGHPLFQPAMPIRPTISHGVLTRVVSTLLPKSFTPPPPPPPHQHDQDDHQNDQVQQHFLPLMIQTDATVYKGNSGGAVFDRETGMFLGLVTCNCHHHGNTPPFPSDGGSSVENGGNGENPYAAKTIVTNLNFSFPCGVLLPLLAFAESRPFPMKLVGPMLGASILNSTMGSKVLSPMAWLWALSCIQTDVGEEKQQQQQHHHTDYTHCPSLKTYECERESLRSITRTYWLMKDESSVEDSLYRRQTPLRAMDMVNPNQSGPISQGMVRRVGEFKRRTRLHQGIGGLEKVPIPIGEKMLEVIRKLREEKGRRIESVGSGEKEA